ncbi:aminoglycoside phosphotransferase family protein [Arthrobacter sp. LAPM80]|uniref:phosphotransferase family protein n=1 Tax=Arthrobacter sp. LAPM80 TaxID=3141788 RepID=UPI00398B16DE
MTVPELVARGIAAGLLAASEVLDGAIAVYPQSRSNVVYRVERHGVPFAYVKQRGQSSMLDGDDVVFNERAVLTELAGVGCLPQVLSIDDPGALWVKAVPGRPLAELLSGGAEFDAACSGLAQSLVELHSWPAAGTLSGLPRAPEPWALRPDELPPSMAGSPPDSACAAVLDLTREPDVRAALEHASSRWTRTAWIHGDVSANNIIIDQGRATLVDLEGAGLGAPDWDLATAVSTLGGLGNTGTAFLTEYWRQGGPARLDDAMLTVRAVQTAWQVAVLTTEQGDSFVDAPGHLEAARKHAASFVSTHGRR